MEGAFVCRNKNAPTRDENGGMDGEALESIFMIVSFCSARYICSIWVIGHFLRKHFWAEITILSRQSNTTNELELKKQQRDQSETFTRRRKLPTHITKWLKEPKWLPTWKLVVNLRSTTVVDDVDSSNNYNASCEWSNSIKQSEQYFKVGFISEKIRWFIGDENQFVGIIQSVWNLCQVYIMQLHMQLLLMPRDMHN